MAWSIIGRLPGAPSGVANFLPRVTPGFIVAAVATLRAASHSVGVAISQVATLLDSTKPGIIIAPITTGTTRPATSTGVALAAVASNSIAQTPAAKVVQIKYDLTATNGSNAATSTGAQAWPNIANAQGTHDGVSAQVNGDLTAARDFTARLAYATQVNKTALAITAVRLDYYYWLNASLNDATRTCRATWTGGSYTSGSVTGQDDRRTTPLTVNLFALGVTDWTKVNSLVAFMDAHTNSGSLGSCQLDAIELIITATQTLAQ